MYKASHSLGCQHTLCPVTVAFRGRLTGCSPLPGPSDLLMGFRCLRHHFGNPSDPDSRAHVRCVPPASAYSLGGGSLGGLSQVLLPFLVFRYNCLSLYEDESNSVNRYGTGAEVYPTGAISATA